MKEPASRHLNEFHLYTRRKKKLNEKKVVDSFQDDLQITNHFQCHRRDWHYTRIQINVDQSIQDRIVNSESGIRPTHVTRLHRTQTRRITSPLHITPTSPHSSTDVPPRRNSLREAQISLSATHAKPPAGRRPFPSTSLPERRALGPELRPPRPPRAVDRAPPRGPKASVVSRSRDLRARRVGRERQARGRTFAPGASARSSTLGECQGRARSGREPGCHSRATQCRLPGNWCRKLRGPQARLIKMGEIRLLLAPVGAMECAVKGVMRDKETKRR